MSASAPQFLENGNDMSLKNKTIAFIGAGNMAEALIRGLLVNQVLPPLQVIATDVRADRLAALQKQFGIRVELENARAAREADIIVLAVKPQQMSAVLTTLSPPPTSLIISIAAGITTTRIERELTGPMRVIRVMPNTPALVGAGAAAMCNGRLSRPEDSLAAQTLLQAVGMVVTVDEAQLDAVTALSGSGPAYIFLVTEALIQAGVHEGLPPSIARQLAIQTVFGAALLLRESSEEAAELRRKVTSPGGTTEAALRVMLAYKLPEIIQEAVGAAVRRSQELSGPK